MSTDLIQLNTIIVNSFFGGVKRGQCLQFTPLIENYAQLERNEVILLRDALNAWLDEPSELVVLCARVGELEQERDELQHENSILIWRVGKITEIEKKWRVNGAMHGMGIYLDLLNELRGVLQFVVTKSSALAKGAK